MGDDVSGDGRGEFCSLDEVLATAQLQLCTAWALRRGFSSFSLNFPTPDSFWRRFLGISWLFETMSSLEPSPYQSLSDTTIGELCRGDDRHKISEATAANPDHGDTLDERAAGATAVGEDCTRSPLRIPVDPAIAAGETRKDSQATMG